MTSVTDLTWTQYPGYRAIMADFDLVDADTLDVTVRNASELPVYTLLHLPSGASDGHYSAVWRGETNVGPLVGAPAGLYSVLVTAHKTGQAQIQVESEPKFFTGCWVDGGWRPCTT